MAAAPQTQTVITYPEACSFVIDFSIPNFSSLKTQTTSVNSDKVAMCGADWYIEVRPLEKAQAKDGETDTDWMAVFLDRETAQLYDDAEHMVNSSITVMQSVNNGISRKTSRYFKCDRIFDAQKGYRGWGRRLFIKHSEIFGLNPTIVLPNGTLKLRAEVQCLLLTDETKLRSCVADSLHERMRYVFESEVGRDVVLVSAEGTERSVHKVHLIAASPVFRGMFESKMEESRTGRCVISDVSSDILEALLKFMYYGCLEYAEVIAADLLVAADKYELLLLKEHCESTLVSGIEMENVAGLLTLADKVEVPRLKKAALEYLAENNTVALTSGKIDDIFKTGDSAFIKEVVAAMLKVDLTA